MADDKKAAVKEFHEYVNMSVKELEKWLDDPKSMETGQTESDGEPTGRKSGRHILEMLKKKEADWSDEDHAHIKKVTAYCKRHLKQGPSKDVENSKWRYSLMNWAHDPLKTKRERSRSPAKSPRKTPEAEKKEKTPEKSAAKEKSPAKETAKQSEDKKEASPAKANGSSPKKADK
ncbi:hypothetical protein WJX73_008126 [Symbiochloris irregularis]|uniref:DNA-binding protein n=1 Tax=Symbiochloris irregularis TaxID=706552 RepID=A0AAW1PYE6_9CHLO